MQTAILDEWVSKQLWEPERLKGYFADPSNSPNKRFVKLVDALCDMDTEALISWCGGHVVSDTFVLMPIHREKIDNIEFHPLPALNTAQVIAREIVDILCPGRFEGNTRTESYESLVLGTTRNDVQADDPTEAQLADGISRLKKLMEFEFFHGLGHPGGFEIAIQPPPFASVSPGMDDIGWSSQADFVTIARNVFDKPLLQTTPQGKSSVAAEHAQLFFFRPGYRAAREYTVPLAELGNFLDRVDPSRQITVCLMGNETWLPHRDSSANQESNPSNITSLSASDRRKSMADFMSSWIRGRRSLMYTGGAQIGFGAHCTLLEDIGTPLLTHRMQAGKMWGVALTRSAAAAWPMSVHPILFAEWNRIANVMFETHPSLQRETPSEVFFSEGTDSCLPVLQFLRVYRGLLIPEAKWREYSAETAKATIVAAHQFVDTHMSWTDFRDAL
jgi:hypothetical protein